MLKKMMKVMAVTIMVITCATTVSAEENPMEAAKREVIEELNEFVKDSNDEFKEMGLDVNNYKIELDPVEERFDGFELETAVRMTVRGDVYIFQYIFTYNYEDEEYDGDVIGIYSELDNGWFSVYDDEFFDEVNARYPEVSEN